MFDHIPFDHYDPHRRLTSRQIPESALQNEAVYGKGNLPNARYSIMGRTDAFSFPPISEEAQASLNYVQAFTVFTYDAPSFTERQNYPSYLLAYTYEGEAALRFQEKDYTLKEGDGFFIDCRLPHRYEVTKGSWKTAILHMDGPLCAPLFSQLLATGSPVFHESLSGLTQQHIEELLRLYCMPHLYRDWQASSCLDALLTHILTLTAHGTPTDLPQNMRYLIRYMESNYREPLSMDDLAAFAGINKHYLSREFRKYVGFSPNDYLISLRIQEAKKQLQTTDRSAAEIAHEVGIHDMNNFTRLFRKKVSMTPTAFRRAAQE